MLTSFDWTRFILSLLIASASAFVAFESLRQTKNSTRPSLWTCLGGLTLGAGIWSTHFHSLLAWHPSFRRFYDGWIVMASVLVAIFASWCALWLLNGVRESNGRFLAASAMALGIGMNAMHIVGMAALHIIPQPEWSAIWIVASIVGASFISLGAVSLLRRESPQAPGIWYRLSGAMMLGVAICGAHFMGMQAMMLSRGAHSVQSATNVTGPALARMGISTVFLFAFGLLTMSYYQSSRWMEIAQSAQREAEDATRQAERLATAGKIAASIAHEINNPLEAVMNLLYLVQDEKGDTQRQEYLQQAQSEIGRIAEITTHTLKFYRQQSSPEMVTINTLFETAIALFQTRLAASEICVQKVWESDIEPVLCRAGEIRQVLANLVSNAIDAMPLGGTLKLGLRKGDGEVEIEVSDTGSGMSQETKEQIFEPFFTTKGAGGTGLGLSICAEIIARHRGKITLTSCTAQGGHGTQFIIKLPYTDQEPQTTFAYRCANETSAATRPVLTA